MACLIGVFVIWITNINRAHGSKDWKALVAIWWLFTNNCKCLSSTLTTCPQISSQEWLAPWLPVLVYTLRYWGAWRVDYPLKSWGNHAKIGMSMWRHCMGKLTLLLSVQEMKDFSLEGGQLCMIWVIVFEQHLRSEELGACKIFCGKIDIDIKIEKKNLHNT